jgi:ribonucleoside-diphosphate reductase alpha chain
MINKHLVSDLLKLGLWNDTIKNKLIMENGSVQNIPEIPTELKEVYKTVWEMSQKRVLQMAANRSIFIDQSQSLNLFVDNATKPKLLAAHLFGWKLGLKTGMYYLRTRAAVDALKGLGVDTSTSKPVEQTSSVNNVEVPTNNTLISEQTPEVVMTSERPTDSPFECEGCGS